MRKIETASRQPTRRHVIGSNGDYVTVRIMLKRLYKCLKSVGLEFDIIIGNQHKRRRCGAKCYVSVVAQSGRVRKKHLDVLSLLQGFGRPVKGYPMRILTANQILHAFNHWQMWLFNTFEPFAIGTDKDLKLYIQLCCLRMLSIWLASSRRSQSLRFEKIR